MKAKVTVVATGGTIASMAERGEQRLKAADLAAHISRSPKIADVTWRDFLSVPSSRLSTGDVLQLVEVAEEEVQLGATGVVITHGTDVLEETAFLLSLFWSCAEPVILTGAMRPAGSVGADGPRNLTAAIATAASPSSRGRGPLVVFNDEIHAASGVAKMHSWAVDTFTSEHGPVGTVNQRNDVRYHRRTEMRETLPRPSSLDEPVALITAGMSSQAAVIDALVAGGFRAVVVEAAGLGSLPPDLHRGLERAVREGMIAVIASRCAFGGTVAGPSSAGIIRAGSLSGIKARLKLMAGLSLYGDDRKALGDLFAKGESDDGGR
ncbi:MAG: asparaginase [Bacillota bacterium]